MTKNPEDMNTQRNLVQHLFEEWKREAEKLGQMMSAYPVSEEYRQQFVDSKSLSQYNETQKQLCTLHTEMTDSAKRVCSSLAERAEHDRLRELKPVVDGASLPLTVLLKKLGAEAEKTKALTNRLMGDYASEDAAKLLREYTELRRKLREKARDKAAFDKAFMLRSEQPKAKQSQTSAPKSTSPQSQNTARTESPFAGIITGSIVQFGRYPRNADGKDSTPIDWRVLAVSGGKALLISEKGLDSQKYNESWTDVTWETCSLRKWMNSTFLNAAFQPEERNRIQNTSVSADKNPEYSTNPGSATTDKLFLLSIPEAKKYFGNDAARRCAPTAYAKAHGAYTSYKYKTTAGEACCWWWLRSPGPDQSRAASVLHGGSVYCSGDTVDSDRDCVRPALWINLDS